MNNEVAEKVADRIIAEIETSGELPWTKPWSAAPKNILSKKPYRGMNALMLGYVGKDEWYGTYKQIKEMGGQVKKGAKGLPVIFYKEIVDKEAGQELKSDGDEPKKIKHYMQYSHVFGLSDTEGLNLPHAKKRETNKIEACEDLAKGIECPVEHGGDSAYYTPGEDKIQMPHQSSFKSDEFYYAALFHEAGHSFASRTGKDLRGGRFGSEEYSEEELVAEVFSSFALNECGVENKECYQNSAAYLKHWLERLKSDKSMIIRAASQAQKRMELMQENAAEKMTLEMSLDDIDVPENVERISEKINIPSRTTQPAPTKTLKM